MYSIVRTYVKDNSPRAPYLLEDVSTVPIGQLKDLYRDVLLVLSNTFLPTIRQIKLSAITGYIETETLNEFLIRNANTTLPTVELNEPNSDVYATWIDGFQLGLDINLENPLGNLESRREDKKDIAIKSSIVQSLELYNNCLFTVNGLIHRANFAGDKILVVDGGVSLNKTNRNTLGVFNLGHLGKITNHRVDCTEVVREHPSTPLGETAYVKLPVPPETLKGKSILLSLGGYLMIPDDRILVELGLGIFKINFNLLPLLERFYDSRDRISMSKVESVLGKSTVNPDLISVTELYSDNGIKAIFDMSQTFFIVVDTPELFVDYEYLEDLGLKGVGKTRSLPDKPLITNVGAMSEYWIRKDSDGYMLSYVDYLIPNYLFNTTELKRPSDWVENEVVDNKTIPYDSHSKSIGRLLKLYKQVYVS